MGEVLKVSRVEKHCRALKAGPAAVSEPA